MSFAKQEVDFRNEIFFSNLDSHICETGTHWNRMNGFGRKWIHRFRQSNSNVIYSNFKL